MRKLVIAVMVGALLTAAVAVSSGSAAPSVHRYTAHARLATLDAHTSVGSVTAPGIGKYGAQIAHYTVKGAKVSGTSVSYDPRGSTIVRFTLTAKANPDGSTTLTGGGKIIGGTGAYRGATGTVKVAGTQAKNATIGDFTYKVAVKY